MNIRVLATEQKRYLIGILELACEKLDITDTERQLAESHYKSVGDWLSGGKDEHLSESTIYTQGSIRIGTIIRPLSSTEFDVDLVCFLPRAHNLAPRRVRDLVGDRLRLHGKYKDMIEPLNRGWRLNFANEFHMDITPAVVDSSDPNSGVLVPDRELRDWKCSNPKGFANWFDTIAAKEPGLLLERLTVEAYVETMPAELQFKGSLRRIVQIMKRHRDIWRSKLSPEKADDAPISIVMTTLATLEFKRLSSRQYDNALDLLLDVVDGMATHITKKTGADGQTESWIQNPTNSNENFADKWKTNPNRETMFRTWHAQLQKDLEKLDADGADELVDGLSQILDESLSKRVLSESAQMVHKMRTQGRATVNASGRIAITGASSTLAVPKNTFYGK